MTMRTRISDTTRARRVARRQALRVCGVLLTVAQLAVVRPAAQAPASQRPASQSSASQVPASPAPGGKSRGWTDYGGGPDSSKFVQVDQITKASVSRLQVAWTYPTGDGGVYSFNPLVVDNVMYVMARNNSIVALDATTGREIWVHDQLRGIARRGINYWESPDRKDRRLLFQMNNFLQAIDARTGQSILTFGKDGLVDLREGLGRDPATIGRIQSNTPGRIFENLILLGSAPGESYLSAPGHLRAYDVVSGKLVWTFHTIPQPGEYGYDTWPKDAYRYVGGANTWGEISVDDKRGIAYFPTGSPTYDYYGADRVGSNLFGNCLLALDARTGKRLWHFQTVHHDLWDYDLTAAPQLITVRRNGKTIDAVAQAGKHGFLFVFDRVTGEPLWPIEERPVPKSEMPGEQAWPTQPFPTVVPPFGRQAMTDQDLTPYLLTPAERTEWQQRLAKARKGQFLPPSMEETVAVPGAVGGANFGNTAADPARGLVFVMSQDFPSFYKLSASPPTVGPPPVARTSTPGDRGRTMYEQTCQACHGADRAGTALAPTLIGLAARMPYADFRQLVLAGRGHMPAFPNIYDEPMKALYHHVTGTAAPAAGAAGANAAPGSAESDPRPQQAGAAPSAGPAGAAAAPKPTGGPVVASGGAPGGQEMRRLTGPRPPGRQGPPPYPTGIDVPPQRYFTDYGLAFPFIMTPPWSSIVAYDLNTGAIKWRAPLGEDRDAAAEGGKNTGMPRGSQRLSMLVTSTGIVFVTTRDGKLRAYDADNGAVLWSGDLPHGAEGIPTMYTVNGREFLVVGATARLLWGRKALGGSDPWTPGETGSDEPGGYIVFALPAAASGSR
jgi:quinoprotein glucose dehydrogenase